ncbi:RloB domain-containing protein [Schaalia sp. ZJ405]|uniref:RloB family protein n=1 Tax=Schaalia sp. ZJ405 TaxID=2709403 RepID=UPI0013ECDB07|nr:RloB domain-containing protein [Schaalia sp. ZJ405]
MNSRKRRPLSDRSRGRRNQSRTPREIVYICAEGKTEEQYIRALCEYRYPRLFAPHFLTRRGSQSARKTSLLNHLQEAKRIERQWTRYDRGQSIWIICDVDQNEVHCEDLIQWVKSDPEHHRVAIQSCSIEAWFVQHFDSTCRPGSNEEAFDALQKRWPKYTKGCEIPAWLIEQTDFAVTNENHYLATRRGERQGVWPVERSSQMPEFISYLDSRAKILHPRWDPSSRA